MIGAAGLHAGGYFGWICYSGYERKALWVVDDVYDLEYVTYPFEE